MQGEMGGMAPERRCHAKATCSKEVGSEGEGRRQRVVLVFVFCKIVPKYHLGPRGFFGSGDQAMDLQDCIDDFLFLAVFVFLQLWD